MKPHFDQWVRTRTKALAQDAGITVAEIVGAYIDDREAEGKNSVEKMRFQWRAVGPALGGFQPADLSAARVKVKGKLRTHCHLYAVNRAGLGRARETIRSELLLIRNAFNWAVGRQIKDTVEPLLTAPKVWVPSQGRPRDTSLTPLEVGRLIDEIFEADAHLKLFMLIALQTGARSTAILELTWDRVDIARRTINFEKPDERDILDTGHEKARAFVDIGEELALQLKLFKEYAQTPYVIEFRGKPVKRTVKGVAALFKRAGITKRFVGTHALRHTLATMLASEGFDMRRIQKLLGHEDIRTTEKIYAKHRRGYLTELASIMDIELRRKLEAQKKLPKGQSADEWLDENDDD
jgi:integrase